MIPLQFPALFLVFAVALGASNYPNWKIIGGEEVDIKDYPYQVSFVEEYGGNIYAHCGGSIISEKFVITAAHCTDSLNASTLVVVVNTNLVDSGGQQYRVKAYHQNPNYTNPTIDYDISILELSENLTFGEGVQPVGLPEPDQQIPPGTSLTVTGYGDTAYPNNDNSANYTLHAVEIYVVDQQECIKDYADSDDYTMPNVTERMICAGVPKGGKDHCYGDSGGPLVVNNTLIGIVSWANGCALEGFPGVNTRVTAVRDFIAEITGL